MKNSASNLSITQETLLPLHKQAEQLLPEVTAIFRQLNYRDIVHQRISQQNSHDIQQQVKSSFYQGLTRAQHSQYGAVMIKWQLSSNVNGINKQILTCLDHEVTVLKALYLSQCLQENTIAIVPSILDYQTSHIKILEQDYQLTSIVMPYYSLGSLAQQLNDKRHQLLADNSKQHFIMQVARLIANLHQQGWLHNDIKPSNLLLNRLVLKDGFLSNHTNSSVEIPSLLLTDFALAEPTDKAFDINRKINTAGTPAYLAPERWQGQSATAQSDIYAFGIMLYEILTGERPFTITAKGNEPLKEWAIEHCQKSIPTLPVEYQQYQVIINKSLAKRLEKRYQDMQSIVVDLELLKNN